MTVHLKGVKSYDVSMTKLVWMRLRCTLHADAVAFY